MKILAVIVFTAVLTALITRHICKQKPVGQLRIDHSDLEETYMFLEIYKGVGDISKKDSVLLMVCNESYISQD